jgi:diphthamide synthase (EF-2-diphthine--ammonia ligase)
MGAAIAQASSQGVQAMAFGDLFLSEIRAYRESQLAGSGMAPLFPLWGKPTDALAREMVDAGVRAVTVCVDTAQIPQHLVGRPFDADLLAALPDRADPCGENGEFHTFVTDGPEFARPVAVTVGEVTCRDGFCFADLLPAG